MAFKGTYERNKFNRGTKKCLIQDFCTSQFNLNESRWPKPSRDLTDTQKLLQRLTKEFNLETTGINVYLEWNTGSDLDINVMCGCGIWHGYGTEAYRGSGGDCFC